MRTNQEINKRNKLRESLEKNGYSELSTSYIVNTYFLSGIEKHWDKLTKQIIKEIERG